MSVAERRWPVQLVQRLSSSLLAAVAAIHLVLVWASTRQAAKHLAERRHLPPSVAAAVDAEGGGATFWLEETFGGSSEKRFNPCWVRSRGGSCGSPLASGRRMSIRPTDSSRDQAKNGTVLFWAGSKSEEKRQRWWLKSYWRFILLQRNNQFIGEILSGCVKVNWI